MIYSEESSGLKGYCKTKPVTIWPLFDIVECLQTCSLWFHAFSTFEYHTNLTKFNIFDLITYAQYALEYC